MTPTLPSTNATNEIVSATKKDPEGFEPISTGVRIATLVILTVPLIGVVVAIALLWGWGITWLDLGLLVGMYLVTGLGITVGFHRLFTHRSFETFGWVRFLLAAAGSMAAQGSVISWVAMHRRHHQHSDRPGDPHSPHVEHGGWLGTLKGLWHAHVGWLFTPKPSSLVRYAPDLHRSKLILVVSALFPVWVLVGLFIPTLLGGLITGTWMGALMGLIWGGLVRMFLVHHVTWGINSICHVWGSQPHDGNDHSKNNAILGILGLGEGWHNNHHTFPTSARHGLRWWQIDISYYVIRTLALFGLAWQVKVANDKNMGGPEMA